MLKSYWEAEALGYYSVKRLREMGLEVRDALRRCSNTSWRPGTAISRSIPGIRRDPSRPPHRPTRQESRSCCPPRHRQDQRRRSDAPGGGQSRKSTGYWIDTPEGLAIPQSHKDVENEIRLILHVVKAGIDQHRHRVEGTAHSNHPLGKHLWAEGPRARRTGGTRHHRLCR